MYCTGKSSESHELIEHVWYNIIIIIIALLSISHKVILETAAAKIANCLRQSFNCSSNTAGCSLSSVEQPVVVRAQDNILGRSDNCVESCESSAKL